MTGVVDALGGGVSGFEPGQAVTIEPLRSCGRCDECRAGLDAICREVEIHGIQRPGGLAEYVSVPARRLFPISPEIDPTIAALTEPMAVAVHGVRRGGLERGQRVLVLGAGSVGLLTVVAARALGAEDVWLTARHPHQAALGAALGASRVLSEEEASLEGLDALGRQAPIDLVVETVGGGADTLISASAAVRPGGAISVVGVFMGNAEINALSLFMKENVLAFSNCYSRPGGQPDFARAVELVTAHRDALAGIATHAQPLASIDEAFRIAADKKEGAIKVSVRP
jgi:threonine dehydrogenase-like Zn-dependent dehydrogenase